MFGQAWPHNTLNDLWHVVSGVDNQYGVVSPNRHDRGDTFLSNMFDKLHGRVLLRPCFGGDPSSPAAPWILHSDFEEPEHQTLLHTKGQAGTRGSFAHSLARASSNFAEATIQSVS